MLNFFKKNFDKRNSLRLPLGKIATLMLVSGLVISAIIAIYFWGNKSAGAQINAISEGLSEQYDARFKNQETQIEKYRQDLKIQAEQNSYDRIRMGDATNILLALQNYNFEKNNLPENLKDLIKGDFYGGNLIDPETGVDYFYKKIDGENYILCFYLSTGIWGTNKSQCPGNSANALPDDKN